MDKLVFPLLALLTSLECWALPILRIVPHVPIQVANAFEIEVQAQGVADLYAFQFDLSFNPALLMAVDTQQGTLLAGSGGFFPGFIDNVAGNVTFVLDTLSGPAPGANGDGTLAALHFTALSAGISTLSLANIILLDSNLTDIAFEGQDGSITVNAPTGVPEPSSLVLAGTCLLLIWFFQWRRCIAVNAVRKGMDL